MPCPHAEFLPTPQAHGKVPVQPKAPNQVLHWCSVSMCPNWSFLLPDFTAQWAKREHQTGRASGISWLGKEEIPSQTKILSKKWWWGREGRKNDTKHKHLTYTLCRNFCLSDTIIPTNEFFLLILRAAGIKLLCLYTSNRRSSEKAQQSSHIMLVIPAWSQWRELLCGCSTASAHMVVRS